MKIIILIIYKFNFSIYPSHRSIIHRETRNYCNLMEVVRFETSIRGFGC